MLLLNPYMVASSVAAGAIDDIAATVASSFRRLYTSQTQFAVVRKGASTEETIEFDGKWIDGQALLDFAGSDDVFVKTLIDASGQSHDLTQSTSGSQPKIVSSGAPILTGYAAGISYDGTDDILSSDAITWGNTVTALMAVHSLSGGDKIAMCSGETTDQSQQNWYCPLTTGEGYPRVGIASGTGGGYGLLDYSEAAGRNGYGGVFANGVITPIRNVTASTSGWSAFASSVVTGNFSARPLHIGGDTRAGFCSTLKHGGFATFLRSLNSDELIAVAKAIGVAASGIVIGDSTVAAYSGTNEVASYILSGADHFRTHGIKSIANPGDTIFAQKAKWQAWATRSLAEWVVVQIGLNDCNPSDGTTAAKIAAIQDLVDTIRADNADCKIVAATMIPAYERWPDLSWNQSQAQARWVAMNDAIMGRGSSPITGFDARTEAHTIAMTKLVDGNAALADEGDTGDHIHPNNTFRAINGAAHRAALGSLGFL